MGRFLRKGERERIHDSLLHGNMLAHELINITYYEMRRSMMAQACRQGTRWRDPAGLNPDHFFDIVCSFIS